MEVLGETPNSFTRNGCRGSAHDADDALLLLQVVLGLRELLLETFEAEGVQAGKKPRVKEQLRTYPAGGGGGGVFVTFR